MDMHECTWDWCGCEPSTRETGMDVHRVYVRLVRMCTEHTWGLNGYTEYTWDLYGYASITRGFVMDMHECTWNWYGCAPSTRETGADVHRAHVGLEWIHRVHVGLVWMCINCT
jgi:hypothetical protein